MKDEALSTSMVSVETISVFFLFLLVCSTCIDPSATQVINNLVEDLVCCGSEDL